MANDPWVVFDYEVDMLNNMCALLRQGNAQYSSLSHHLRNAVVESAVLHARNLADILLSRSDPVRFPDDIRLMDLAPTFTSPAIAQLQAAYGTTNSTGSTCWAFNKKLAHSTTHRNDSYDYAPHLNAVVPLIFQLVSEIEQHRL